MHYKQPNHFTAIVKFIVTFSGKTVPSGIPPTLALMIVDTTTVSGRNSWIGNNVEQLYTVTAILISSFFVAFLMLLGKCTPNSWKSVALLIASVTELIYSLSSLKKQKEY